MDYPTTHRSISFTVLFICLTTVLVLLGVRAIEVRVDAANAADGNGTALRLQVIPHSDHPRDQDLKLMVRDEVLALLKEDIQSPQPSEAAVVDAVRERIPLIEERVAALLETAGRSLPIAIQLEPVSDPSTFGERYGGAWGAADEAIVLRIILGEGRGSNFWCVIFPNMCFVSDSVEEYFPLAPGGNIVEAAPGTDVENVETAAQQPDRSAGEDAADDSPKIEFRWRLWEHLEQSRASRMIRGLWDHAIASLFARN